MLDKLDTDCVQNVVEFLLLPDIVKCSLINKQWNNAVTSHDYIRTFFLSSFRWLPIIVTRESLPTRTTRGWLHEISIVAKNTATIRKFPKENKPKSFFSSNPKEYLCIMCGVERPGQTSILYQMKLGEIVSAMITIGFNVENIPVNSSSTLVIWDLGSVDRIRPLWPHYVNDTITCMIYVVDCYNKDTLQVSRDEFFSFVTTMENIVHDFPILIFANKQDIDTAVSAQYVHDFFFGFTELDEIERTKRESMFLMRDVRIQPCCANNGRGILDGIEWLVSKIRK